jgi:hypothetical protein
VIRLPPDRINGQLRGRFSFGKRVDAWSGSQDPFRPSRVAALTLRGSSCGFSVRLPGRAAFAQQRMGILPDTLE